MKTLISYVALALLLLASSSTIANQSEINEQSVTASISTNNDCFNYMRVHRMGKAGVQISWSVSTNEIDHFIVERSYDGEFFESVNMMGFNGSANYKVNDNNVFGGDIHYRITAVKTDGSVVSSTVKSVRIVQRG